MPTANIAIALDDRNWRPGANAVGVKLRYTRTNLRNVNVAAAAENRVIRVEANLEEFEFIVHLGGEALDEGALFREGVEPRTFVARIDYDGGPPVLWKAIAYEIDAKSAPWDPRVGDFPLRGLTTVEQFRERLRRIAADGDTTRRLQMAFFYQLDLETHPKLIEAAELREMDTLRAALSERLWSRGLVAAERRLSDDELPLFLSTIAGGKPAVNMISSTTITALDRFTKQLESLINGYVRQPDDTGALTPSQFEKLAAAVEAFANRELEVLDSLGSPDSWGFTYFAELAFSAVEQVTLPVASQSNNTPFWRQVASIFSRASVIFWVGFYRGGGRRSVSYRWTSQRRGWTDSMLTRLRSDWPLDPIACSNSVDSALPRFETMLCDAVLDEIRDATYPDMPSLMSPLDDRLKRRYWADEPN